MKVVFMGTPEFAVASLNQLIIDDIEVAAIVTVPDRKSGRGLKVNASAVKNRALELNIPILQPEKLKDEKFLERLESFQADLFVVVAFRMLPEVVWKMPQKGTINLHGSLLPQYRGAAPINWAIINGEKETGATTFFIDEKIDTGAIIDKAIIAISDEMTAGELHDKMMLRGAKLLSNTVKRIFSGEKIQLIDQKNSDEAGIQDAPKIFKEDCRINWQNNIDSVYNKIRGLSPYPAAWCEIQTAGEVKTMKIFLSEKVIDDKAVPGNIRIEDKEIYFGAKGGWIKLNQIQLEGKKKMMIKDFLNGFDFKNCKLI